nr:4308_t:CDS:2 [Entrophospora candida]
MIHKLSYGTFNNHDPDKPFHTSLESDDKNVIETFKQSFQIFPTTIIIKNAGSMARDQLSIQRTFLNFLKTGLSLFLVGASFLIHFHIDGGDSSENQNSDDNLFNISISFFSSSMQHNAIGLGFIFLAFYVITWATINYLKFQKMLINSVTIIQHDEFNILAVIAMGLLIITALLFLQYI